jgi:heavy metal efflux system protein
MLTRIVELSARQRGVVLLATLALICVGAWAASRLPIDAVPDVTPVQVQINAEVLALAPEEIEQAVTIPMELEMGGIQGLVEMRSLSKFGLSQLTLIFTDETDVYRARQLVAERLQNVQDTLPRGVQPKLAPITTGLSEIYFYTVDYKPTERTGVSAFRTGATNIPADRYEQLQELTLVQDWTIKPALRTIPGVAEVISWGGYNKQIVVQPSAEKLQNAGLSFAEFAAKIAENLENAGGSGVEIGGENLVIRSLGRVQSASELAELPLKFGAGVRPIQVKDVAEVAIGSSVRTGAATENGEEAVMGVVLMVAGENSRVVSQAVHHSVRELQSKLPAGMEIRSHYNRSELVNSTIATVTRNLAEGAILVVAVLFFMLGNWRAAIIVALVIPLSMLFAMFGMVRLGISGNLMSLGAIDFGLIIDGAVVMVENIVRRLAEKRGQVRRMLTVEERLAQVLLAGREVARPMFFGVLVITLVYIPILGLAGVEGKMFRPMAVVVMLALGGSLVLALTLMPALSAALLGHRQFRDDSHSLSDEEDQTWLVRAFKKIYIPVLSFALRYRLLVIVPMILLFAWSVWLFTRLGSEFIPQLDEGSLVIQMVRANSIALSPSLEMQQRAERIIRQEFPEVVSIFSRIGTPDVATDPMGLNLADTYLTLAPREKWRRVEGRAITKEDLAVLIERTLAIKSPGQENLFTQPIEMRFNEILAGSRADIVVSVFGTDFQILEELAGQVREILEKTPGAAELALEAVGKAPNIEVTPDREAMATLNVHGAEINAVVATALAGQEVGQFLDGTRRYPVVVRMNEAARRDLARLEQLPLSTDHGGLIPLGKVAKVAVVERVNVVTREAGQRRVSIMVNLRGRDTQRFVEDATARIRAQVDFPEGYTFEFGGQYKNLVAAKRRLMIVVPLALALIFVLIYVSFGSARQAALIFASVPLAVTGGVVALWARGMPFTISAGVGFIALSGIAVLNGIMLISFINQLRRDGRDLRSAVLEGTLTRLRPKLMTALVASLGFVPMALSRGAGAEVQRPLATVVIGGIISSTFLTLVLLPTLYEWIERKTKPASRETMDASSAVMDSPVEALTE